MSADEETTPAATETVDTTVADGQSKKRKASVAGDAEQERAASPKRLKLDGPEAETAPTKDGPAQAPEPESKHQDEATGTNPQPAQERKQAWPSREQHDPSALPPPPRRTSPKPSRSPSPSFRRPSIPTPEPRQAPGPDRGGRKSISEQEKKRGQRLFGGLLSTLSQKPGGGSSSRRDSQQEKRRAELGRRQREREQQQRAEDDSRRAEKLAKLNRKREIEQVRFEEDAMIVRHQGMFAEARSLSTKAEPKLFYLPWKLTKDQRILRREQLLATAAITAEEAQQFDVQKRERLAKLGVTLRESIQLLKDTDTNGRTAEDKPPVTATLAKPADDKPSPEKAAHDEAMTIDKPGPEGQHDDAGYVMVENDEDTVIY